MSGTTSFLYHPDFLLYQFGPGHPFQPVRAIHTLETLMDAGIIDGVDAHIVEPEGVDMQDLNRVHPPAFVAQVENACAEYDLLDHGDTPGSPELFQGALMAVGASVRGARGIMEGEFEHAFNPAGGLHHAKPTSASGFCVFNDLAVTVQYLRERHGVERVAVIDIDGHHGDGTQGIFYGEKVLTISLHRHGHGFYPGSGTVDERGEGQGQGFNINIPLPAGTDDAHYLDAYRTVVVPALRAYAPEFIIHQFGADGHRQDPLVGLGLTTRTYVKVAAITHSLAHELCDGRYLVTGGGGYDLDATRRTWSLMFAQVCGGSGTMGKLAVLHDREVSRMNDEDAALTEAITKEQEMVAVDMLERSMMR
ncbi:MAG: acetoin utilization protein AcuC [Methanomassiliicoccus sp.]|nr:acetoin utilization protein AcuC [Methanomassiliicoccus sp.]